MADASSTKHICAILWIHTICLQSSHNGASYILSLGPKEKRQSACPLTHSPMNKVNSDEDKWTQMVEKSWIWHALGSPKPKCQSNDWAISWGKPFDSVNIRTTYETGQKVLVKHKIRDWCVLPWHIQGDTNAANTYQTRTSHRRGGTSFSRKKRHQLRKTSSGRRTKQMYFASTTIRQVEARQLRASKQEWFIFWSVHPAQCHTI